MQAFGFSMFTSVGRFGMLFSAWFFSLYSTVPLEKIYVPVAVISFVCVFGLVCAGLASYMDRVEDENVVKADKLWDDYQKSQLEKGEQKEAEAPLKVGTYFESVKKTFKNLSLLFWIISLTNCIGYMVYFSFSFNTSGFLKRKYKFEGNWGIILITLPYVIGATTTPLYGLLIDKFGKRSTI